METFNCWLIPSPNYDKTGFTYPISSTLIFVASGKHKPKALPAGTIRLSLTYKETNSFLVHNAERWAYFDYGHGEQFDCDRYSRLLAAYFERLRSSGFLDFTKPCAGIRV